jgi:hypothetical protein
MQTGVCVEKVNSGFFFHEVDMPRITLAGFPQTTVYGGTSWIEEVSK